MREFRKKQKQLKRIMNALVIFSAIFIFIYIGAAPFIVSALGNNAQMVFAYICDGLVVGCMVLVFTYYTKYGKVDAPLDMVEHELSDAGYYLSARNCQSNIDYISTVCDDLRNTGFSVNENVEMDDFDFSAVAVKKNDFFYIADIENVDRNDVIAYLDTVTYDVTVKYLRRKGNVVILFVTDKAMDDAVALAKMVTVLGKKGQLKIAFAIMELSTNRCYFLGNKASKCQQMIANYAMNCDVPIKDEFIGKERLSCQDELEEHMMSFDLKKFRDGQFLIH